MADSIDPTDSTALPKAPRISESAKGAKGVKGEVRSSEDTRKGTPAKMNVCNKTLGALFIIGLLIFAFGLTTGIIWSTIYQWIFTGQITLTPSSTNFKLWKETPIPMYLKIYMFNWTNPDKIESKEKPNFVEMGPYVFKEVDYKVNKVWNDNGTVTFQRKRVWHFDDSLSNGKLTDQVTNVNPVVASIAYLMRHKGKLVRDVVDRLLIVLKEKLFITKTVGELLFDGYNDTMLLIAKKLKLSRLPYTKFGWFYERNGTDDYDGTFNMLTGKSDIHDLGIIKEWNYSNRSLYYDDSCGEIGGTNGDLWPPLPSNETVSIFVSDICTSLNLTYENTTTFLGLTGSRFISDANMLDNGTNVPSRSCYCKNRECEPSGLLNISMCKYGAPAFVSLPHFYLADQSYRDAITGMNPDKEKHEMKIVVEPSTGVPMQVKAQLQLNLLMQPDDQISVLKKINKTYVPMLWFTQEANLTKPYAHQVKVLLTLPEVGGPVCFGVAALGLVLFSIGMFLCLRRSWQSEENQRLLPKNDLNGVDRTEER